MTLLLCHQVQAVYLQNDAPNVTGDAHTTNEQLPSLCQIYVRNKILGVTAGSYDGTGTFVSANVILTCAHVLGNKGRKDKLNPFPLKNITVKVHTSEGSYEEYRIKERLFYKDKVTEENLALLILEEKAKGVRPAPFRALDLTSLPDKITFAGYGDGEIMDKESCHPLDIKQYYHEILKLKDFPVLRHATVKIDGEQEEFSQSHSLLKLQLDALQCQLNLNEVLMNMHKSNLELEGLFKILPTQEPVLKGKEEASPVLESPDQKMVELLEEKEKLTKEIAHLVLEVEKEKKTQIIPIVTLNSHTVESGSGDSGGPLMNKNGEVIGVVEWGIDAIIHDPLIRPNTKKLRRKALAKKLKSLLPQQSSVSIKEFAVIYEKQRKKLWKSVGEKLQEESLRTGFQALTEDVVAWIHQVIAQHHDAPSSSVSTSLA